MTMSKLLYQIHFNIFFKWGFEELLIDWLCTVPTAYGIKSKYLHLTHKFLELFKVI